MITKDIIKYQYKLFFHEYHWEPQPCLRHAKVAKMGMGSDGRPNIFPSRILLKRDIIAKKKHP